MSKSRSCGLGDQCEQITRRRTIFGDVKESNIVFCVDTSGSIHKVWDQISSQIIEHLCKIAIHDKKSTFNVITFGDNVKRFRAKLVPVNYKNIEELNKWLRNVIFGTNSYISPALLSSYSYVEAECVLLVTDGLLTKELYDTRKLSSVCNSRPLYLTLLINNVKPDNASLELASKLITMTCCPKSRLNVIMVAFSGCFVQLSPLEWCVKVPSKLYGCPNLCYKYVLDNLHKYKETREAGGSVEGLEVHKPLAHRDSEERILQVKKIPTDHLQTQEQQVQTSSLFEINDSQTQTVSETSEEVNTTDPSSLHNSCNGNHFQQCCRRGHSSCFMCQRSPKYSSDRFKQSRYRAARSFMNGRDQLDWWADDIRIAPSAGALLLGHIVLAPKYNDGNRIYMATVLSQVDYCTFIICFEDPDSEIKHRENFQEIHVHELISYLDFHRHPIHPGDFVLVPQSAIIQIDQCCKHPMDKHFLVPFQLGKVLSGFESRSSCRKAFTLSNIPLEVEFIRQDNNEVVSGKSCKIPLNTALWIPHELAVKKLLSNKTQCEVTPSTGESPSAVYMSTCSTSPADITSSQPVLSKQQKNEALEVKDAQGLSTGILTGRQDSYTDDIKSNKSLLRPFCQLPPFSVGGVTRDDSTKNKGLQYAYTKDEIERMKSEFIDSDYASSIDETGSAGNQQRKKLSKSESNIISKAFHDFHSDCANQFIERKSYESENIYRPTNDEALRIYNQMKDVSTSVDAELQHGKMHIKWVKQQKKQFNRPEWRYWGSKPIPQLIGPPIFEPFKDATAWGRSDRLTTTVECCTIFT
ncbi:unnamed protein product [Trichobilharzia szidati]|nr:unnamed protein product [Trichobilharzia szidati]